MKYYLAIDIGTTNWKAAIYNERGIMQNIERMPTQTHTDQCGNHFYDAAELWNSVRRLCKTVMRKSGVSVSGVSVTSIAEAVVGVDSDGKTVGDIITWFDVRSLVQAEQLKQEFGEDRLYEITGLDVNPIFSLPKIMWIREHQPQVYERAVKWLQMADYVLFCLTGICVTDYTLASRTLAFDVKSNKWSEEILSRVGISVSVFPQILESGTVIGAINAAVSSCTGITVGAKVVIGGNDHPCASISAGVLNGSKILDSSGTAESFLHISQKYAVPRMKFEGQRTCRYLQKDRYVLWGGIISSGRSFDWAYEMFTSSENFGILQSSYSYGDILPQLEQAEGMETGLIFYPHLRGAGAPYWNPKVTGSFIGIRDRHTSKDMMKSVLEGLCMQARVIIEMEQKILGNEAERICVVGGSSRNHVWQKIKANVLKKEIELCREPEAASLGAAMLAAVGDRAYKNIEEVSGLFSEKNEVIYPDERIAARYDALYPLYCEGYEQLRELNEKLYQTAVR